MLQPGFAVIHSNELETLRDLLVSWMKENPLAPLASEDILVQSNGIAQWLKMALAETGNKGMGIAAGLRVELPNQFIWRLYRAVLGNEVPVSLPYDKPNLRWRLLRMLPTLSDNNDFEPITRYLSDDADGRKTWHLAERLADLFDQYQVYRADWLNHWSEHKDVLPHSEHQPGDRVVPADQLWQPALWRALRNDMEQIAAPAQFSSRADVHNKAWQAIEAGQFAQPEKLPSRVIVFGISSLPEQTLQLLAALGQHRQVLLAVLNPCQHFWGDITTLKDQIRQQRHALKASWADPAMHDKLYLNSPPLLASWGKQGRDYIDLLAQFDEPAHYREWFGGRIDLFSGVNAEDDVEHLPVLAQIQHDILNLNPVPELKRTLTTTDQSISFHRCHSRQREIEVLQDRLLQDFLDNPELRARDVIVMTPDISQYSAHVDAVFGGVDRDDTRYLSYSLADQQGRGQEPLLIALEYLLTVDQQQITLSEVLDILDVPAVQQRFELEPTAVPQLREWLSEAGVRWGIDTKHRQQLGITSMDDAFSWAFGVERILLGYAMGEEVEWGNRLAYAEVAGLGAEQLGPVLSFIHVLREWFESIHEQPSRTLSGWLAALQGEEGLLGRCFDFSGDQESRLYTRLMAGLERLESGAIAGQFDGELPLSILREAWLAEAEESGLSQRFMAGSVTFSTLLPMRAIPFKRIYVLGMNDGEYPRSRRPDDFDLMSGDYRPGDRSRRDDDRYLFLEALLSAREAVYYSWVGFNIQDNTERPPSVLLAQLMDLLEQGWQSQTGLSALADRVHDYPLQPFSPHYFGTNGLPTFAYEWESLFQNIAEKPIHDTENSHTLEPESSQRELVTLLKQPVDFYVQQRFKTRFFRQAEQQTDHEPFALDGLDNYLLQSEALEILEREGQVDFGALKNKWKKSGVLPYGIFGERATAKVADGIDVLQQRFEQFQQAWQRSSVALPQHISIGGVVIETAFNSLWQKGDEFTFVLMRPSAIEVKGQLRWSKILSVWVQMQLAAVTGYTVHGHILGLDTAAKWVAPSKDEAEQNLISLLEFRTAAAKTPLPMNAELAAALLNEATITALEDLYNGTERTTGEVQKSVALQRYYPDFNSLANDYECWAQGIYKAVHSTPKEQV